MEETKFTITNAFPTQYKGTMKSLSTKCTYNYQLKFAPQYKWTKDKKCYNTKTNREIKKVYNNGSIGYNINGRFRTLKYLRPFLEPTKNNDCPF